MNKDVMLDSNTLKVLIEQGLITLGDIEKLSNQEGIPQDGSIPVLQSINKFYLNLKQTSSRHTALGYRRDISNFVKSLFDVDSVGSLRDITYGDKLALTSISNWFDKLEYDAYSSTSIRRAKYAMKSYVEFLTKEYGNQIINIDVIEVPEIELSTISIMTDSEVRAMAECATNLRNKLMILFIYETSMRRQELIDFKKKDVDFSGNCVKIRNKEGDIDRIGYITTDTKRLILEHMDEWEATVEEVNIKRRMKGERLVVVSEYLFQTLRGHKVSYSTVFKAIKDSAIEYFSNLSKKCGDIELLEKAKLIDTEVLRHSKRAYLFSIGKSVDEVQIIMGDANYWVTKRYLSIAQQIYPESFR